MNYPKNKITLFAILNILALIIFVLTIIVFSVYTFMFNSEDKIIRWARNYDEDCFIIYEDGSKNKVELPYVCLSSYENSYMETTLPTNIESDAIIGTYVYDPTIIYIDGKVRAEFNNDENIVPGKNSKLVFLQVKLNSDDAGKVMKICRDASIPNDSFSRLYYGDSLGIFEMIFHEYGVQFCLAAFLFLISIIITIASLMFIGKINEWKQFLSLGIGFTCSTIWIMVDNVLIQYLTGLYYIEGALGYILCSLLVIPFLYFINVQQKRRYEKFFNFIYILLLIDTALITFLHYTDIITFRDTRVYMNLCLAIALVFIVVTLVFDIVKNYIQEYKKVMIGLLALAFAAVIEVIKINTRFYSVVGLSLIVGLFFFLIMALVQIFSQIDIDRKMAYEAVRANKLKSEFLASMSHEIRTPINAIMGLNEMILRENTNKDIEFYATNIKHSSNNLLTIINDILDFSKIESGKMDLIEREYSFINVINDVVTMMEIKANDKKLKFVKDIDYSLPDKLYGDDGKIRQIMINVINNAIKYTKEGEIKIIIYGTLSNDNVLISFKVVDTGIGIKDEDIDKLFKKFSRVDSKKNINIEGTGLGLAITKSYTEMMGGTITVKSQYGKGSTFTIYYPQHIVSKLPMSSVTKDASDDIKVDDKKKLKVKSSANILVVDDVEINLVVIESLLKETGVSIDTAISGKDCLEKIKNNKYHIIFMDHMMPDLDGIETLKIIKEDKSHVNQDTPVIMLTANAIVGAEQEYRDAGFVDYLSKPVDGQLLEDMVKKYLPKEFIIN